MGMQNKGWSPHETAAAKAAGHSFRERNQPRLLAIYMAAIYARPYGCYFLLLPSIVIFFNFHFVYSIYWVFFKILVRDYFFGNILWQMVGGLSPKKGQNRTESLSKSAAPCKPGRKTQVVNSGSLTFKLSYPSQARGNEISFPFSLFFLAEDYSRSTNLAD